MKKAKIKKKTLKLKDIKFHPKNPKKHWEEGLEKSIGEMGYIEPIVVDENNQLLAGHGRVKVMRRMGYKELDAIVVKGLSEEQKEKYLLMSNKIGERGGWDDELLVLFNEDTLSEVGFDEKKLESLFEDEEATIPEVEFTEEILLEHNYVVLYFDNTFDWEVAKEKFNLKKVKDLIPRKAQPTGIGRVIDGGEWIDRIK